jgi:methionyl-tRNA formyltransferase
LRERATVSASPSKARAIFFGTPEFAVPCLSALAELHELVEVVCVITQPDRPSGRGMKLTPPPVKVRAQELGVPVLQPTKVRTPEFAAELRALRADVAVVVAYGRILPVAVLTAPRLGCVNVHASLLPKLRGAAPIQWSIVHGDRETGVCLMQMDEGMDTGAVLARAQLPIGAEETAAELTPRLSALGAQLLREQLPCFLRGELSAVPQDHAAATLAPVLRKDHGQIDWQGSAQQIHDLVRGMNPWPGAYSWLEGVRIKLHAARVQQARERVGEPGSIVRAGHDGIEVACGQGSLLITEVQLEGSRRMPAGAFVAGHRLPSDARFTMSQASS